MAITIIKRGELPSKRLFTGKCHNCKTEVEFEQADAQSYTNTQRDGECASVTCPVCNQSINGYPKRPQ